MKRNVKFDIHEIWTVICNGMSNLISRNLDCNMKRNVKFYIHEIWTVICNGMSNLIFTKFGL